MNRIFRIPTLLLVLGISASTIRAQQSSSLGDHDGNGCPPSMVRVGSICIDKYEASVWSKPPKNDGRPRGTQYGVDGPDYPCDVNGNDCSGANPIYAASVPGLVPSSCRRRRHNPQSGVQSFTHSPAASP